MLTCQSYFSSISLEVIRMVNLKLLICGIVVGFAALIVAYLPIATGVPKDSPFETIAYFMALIIAITSVKLLGDSTAGEKEEKK